MRTVGIIAEYNPFHTGHAYHIEESRRKSDADGVLVVMSGNFVQRGAPAVAEKYFRAATAITGGADLVVELPTIYATQSAEIFATGAISILNQTGIIDNVYFGTETEDNSLLKEIADILATEPEDFKNTLKNELKNGKNPPTARAIALKNCLNNPEIDNIINSPNNILGIEYLKAIKLLKSDINGCSIKREGSAYHDTDLNAKFASATALRETMQCIDFDFEEIEPYMTKKEYDMFNKEYMASLPIYSSDISGLLYHALLLNRDKLTQFMDVNSNIADKICNYLDSGDIFDFEGTIKALKTKELTYTRISRALINILLGITNEDIISIKKRNYPAYLRVLAFNECGQKILSKIKKTSDIPIITNLADSYKKVDEPLKRMLDIDIFSTNIYRNVVKTKFDTVLKDEFRIKPIIF